MAALSGTDHWKLERVVAIAMLAIIPGSFVFDSAFMNYLLAGSLAIHAHWGWSLIENDAKREMFISCRNGYSSVGLLPKTSVTTSECSSIYFDGNCFWRFMVRRKTRVQ